MINLLLLLAAILCASLGYRSLPHAIGLLIILIPTFLIRTTIYGIPTTAWECCVLGLWCGMQFSSTTRKKYWHALGYFVGLKIEKQTITNGWRTGGPPSSAWNQKVKPSDGGAGATGPDQKLFFSKPSISFIAVVGILVAAGISTYISAEPRVSLGILKGWFIIPLLFASMVYADRVMRGERVLMQYRTALIMSGIVPAIYGLLQAFHGGRVASIYDVPNSLALWLAPLMILAVWHGTTWLRVAGVLFGVVIVATQSVAAVAAVSATLVMGLIIFSARSVRRTAVPLLLIFFVGSSVYLWSSGRLNYFISAWQEQRPTSLTVRHQLWSVSVDLIRQHPVFGVGLGQFEPVYQRALHERFRVVEQSRQGGGHISEPLREFVFRDPHNWFLAWWLNTGLLGVACFTVLHVYLIYRAWSRDQGDTNTQAFLLSLLCLLLFGLVDTIYWKNDLAALQWLLWVVLIH